MTSQAPLPGIDSAGQPAAEHAGRAVYRERLRQYLQDPAFRAILGFPIGEDEAILALSDPPFYTACPNPFLPEIVVGWQQERAGLRRMRKVGALTSAGGTNRFVAGGDLDELAEMLRAAGYVVHLVGQKIEVEEDEENEWWNE